jgi:predicted permease
MMRWLYKLPLRFRSLFRKDRVEQELSEELRFHLDELIEQNIVQGMMPGEARYAARRDLGGIERIREECRDMRRVNFLENLLQDSRHGLRQLCRTPGFAVVAVLSLGLGIGANSAIFSVIDALLYRPLPYPHPERLAAIWSTEQGHTHEAPPIAEEVDWKKQNRVFDDIALTSSTEPATESGLGEPQPIRVQYVTPNFFSLLGATPILGRVFLAGEMQDRTQTIVISSPFWKSHFNGDPRVLGRSFNISGVVSTVVGVMPPGFAPFYGDQIDLWEPINPESIRYAQRRDHWLMPVARLKPGVSLAQAQSGMDTIARRLAEAYPETNKGVGKRVVPLREELYGWAGRALYPLLGAVGFVLLIACLNVANLLQSRAEIRRKEFAVRASIGASRRRLVQQLIVESAILALLGAGAGVVLSFGGIRLFLKLAGEFPNADAVRVDGRVLLFTLGIAVFTAAIFGLMPAIQASNPDLNRGLREGERRTTVGRRGDNRHILVVCEVALAMVLLVGAGLMVNTLLRLQRVNPGFKSANILTMNIFLPEGGKYLERVPGGDMERALPTVEAFHRQLLEKVEALPAVESVGLVSGVPTHWTEPRTFSILGRPAPPPDRRPETEYDEASPGYFKALRIPLKKGRYLDDHDTGSAPWVAVVNDAFARRYFPNEDPIGQRILMRYSWSSAYDEEYPRQIVGVVGDIKQFGLGEPASPFVYASYFQQPAVYPGGNVVTHLRSDLVIRAANMQSQEAGLVKAVKKAVAEIDPDQPITGVMTMDQVLAESTGDQLFYIRLLGIFAGLALILALVGIYGVMAYFVVDRTHEIGVRMALGAERTDVLGLVVKLAFKLSILGVASGALLGLGVTRLLGQYLFGVKPTDPVTFSVVALALIAVALLASYIPARRAAEVDPMMALRHE